jgi:glutathione S-transferase
MHYLTVAEARSHPGLRLVLSAGAPGPWGIAARAVLNYRGVPWVAVRQELMQANEELVAWTGRRNAPVAVYNDEPAVDGWLEIAVLAERLGSGPSLFPADPLLRALAVGFTAEISGADGFGWSRRLSMALRNREAHLAAGGPPDPVMAAYGMTAEAIAAAPARVVGILQGLAAQLHRQAEAGSEWLVGESPSLADLHWAAFSQLVAPIDHANCPMPQSMRAIYESTTPEIAAAVDPVLIEHRDRVYARHIGLPLDF